MRVVMISTDSLIAQPRSRVAERMQSYAAACGQLTVVVTTKKQAAPYDADALSVVPVLFTNKLSGFVSLLRVAVRVVAAKQPDVVTVQDPFFVGCVGVIVCWLKKKSLHVQVHTDIFSPYWQKENPGKLFLARRVLRRANQIRVVVRTVAEQLVDQWGLERAKISVLPIRPDIESIQNVQFVQKYKQFLNRFVLLTVARLVPVKNIAMVLQAVHIVARQHPEILFVIVGAGILEQQLQDEVRDLKIEDHVLFAGWSSHPEQYFVQADAFVLSSWYEGRERTTIEAMALGVPVISTPVGWANECIRHEKNGLIVEHNNHQQLASAVQRLIENPAVRTALSQAGKATVQSFQSQEKYVQTIVHDWKKAI